MFIYLETSPSTSQIHEMHEGYMLGTTKSEDR